MNLELFALERIQSEWENLVDINLTESGVEPISISELVTDEEKLREILGTPLGYSQTNGTPQLREIISSIYEGATAENVLVTNGCAEANFLTIWNLLLESDSRKEIVMMQPNYNQILGLTRALGGKLKPFHLQIQGGEWVPDIEELKEVVSKNTLAVTICNPNNPTGATFSTDYLKAIGEISEDIGAWILSDEIYQGAELEGPPTPTMFNLSERVIVTNSLSKAYGLPGLRLGWIVTSDKKQIDELWAYSDYTTIGPSNVSDMLATIALQYEMREWLLKRASQIVSRHWDLMKKWLDERAGIFDYVAPKAASICFPRYDLPISSLELVNRLLREKRLLIAPGAYFGVENHLRIGFGYDENHLEKGLALFDEMIQFLCK